MRFGFRGREAFLGPVDLALNAGEALAVVGPNGAGKSTLLRCMAGLLKPRAGVIRLRGESVHAMSPARRARHIAFLPQHPPRDLAFTAREVVLMGRFPHRSLGLFESAEDHRVADDAMARTGVSDLADRPLASLSGGEAQLVHVAAMVAQGGDVLLFDEPTAALDFRHQLAILSTLRRLAREGRAVVFVTHDLNLAARFASRLLLMERGRTVREGLPLDVLQSDVLASVYGVKVVALGGTTPGWFAPELSDAETPP